jgi:hypothetical protein
MKKMLVLMSLVLSLAMLLTLPAMTFADEDDEIELEEEIEIEEEEEDDEEGKGPKKEWKNIKKELQAQKRTFEMSKDELESRIEEIEAELEALEGLGEDALVAALLEELGTLKEQFGEIKSLMKLKIREMQQVMREKYTQEEWDALMEKAEELEGFPGITVLPAENILMPGKNLKFDVPPVIKDGRILIPIRAISTALGADVDWDNGTKTATIVYGETTIVFVIALDAESNENIVTVDGEPVELDVEAEVMEGRIVVPLRFIVENMGLEIEWDQETETAEITDSAELVE